MKNRTRDNLKAEHLDKRFKRADLCDIEVVARRLKTNGRVYKLYFRLRPGSPTYFVQSAGDVLLYPAQSWQVVSQEYPEDRFSSVSELADAKLLAVEDRPDVKTALEWLSDLAPLCPIEFERKFGYPLVKYDEITKPGETRTTFILNEALYERVKQLAYWGRVPIKDVVHEALESYCNARTVV